MTLGERFPIEQARVRELLVEYEKLGPVGIFGAAMIRQALENADKAAVSGDVVAMLQAYEELRGCA